MNLAKDTCYCCEQIATSREHVPPKCLFPLAKDIHEIYGQSFRSNLLTVPSCEKHNLMKSNDDEYLMACLTARVGNNGVAFAHTHTKLKRALQRNPRLIHVEKETDIVLNGILYPTLLVNIDVQRLTHSFESIGRGLYFYEHRKRFIGECTVISDIFLSPNSEWTKSNVFIQNAISLIRKEQEKWFTPTQGENPEIFTYQFSPVDGFGSLTLVLTFYRYTEIYICFAQKEVLKPYKDSLEFATRLFLGL